MNQSIWERRQAVASRLEGQAQQERSVLTELTATFTAASLRLEDVDPRGCLRASVAAVAQVAAGRPGFNLVLGAVGHGIRVQSDEHGDVTLSVVTMAVGEPAPRAVASELAALLWDR
ncbi:hypothetical protein [Kineococcus sp. SYSU DK001]|uniref:hypothetical protein n=1 Tax=Kineococcus sp. SYSU DK001 TaxID=3383122 RepID=UPI003D7EB9C3